MSRRKKAIFDLKKLDALQNVALPDRIKCGRCNRYKSQTNFSNKQLNDARYEVQSKGHHAKYKINCKPCTGVPLVELECTMCGEVQGLEAFAKSQKKRPDTAQCFVCVEKHLDQDPVEEEAYETTDRSKLFIRDQTPAGAVPTVWTEPLASTASSASESWEVEDDVDDEDGGCRLSQGFSSQLSLSTPQEDLLDLEFLGASQPAINHWQTAPTRSWHTKSNQTPSDGSVLSSKKAGKLLAGSDSGSVAGSVHTFSSGHVERDTTSSASNFPKVKAYNPKKDPDYRPRKDPSPEVSDSSESESDSDTDNDDDSDETEI